MAGSDSGRNWPYPVEDLGGEENLLLNFERVAKTRLGNGNTTPNPSPPKPNLPPQVNTTVNAPPPQLLDPNFKFKVKVPPVAPPVSIPIQPIAKAKTTRKSERLAGKPKKSFQPDESKQDDLDQELDEEEEEEEEDSLDDEEEYEEGGELYCICRTSKSSGFMICCDICEQWYHGTCIKLAQKDAQYFDKYHCPNCEKTHGPSTYKSLPPPPPPRQNKRQKSEGVSPAPKSNVTSNPAESVTGPRKRKESGFYKELEEGNLNIDGNKESKVATNFLKYLEEKKISNENVAKTLNGNEWNIEYVEKYGINYPIKFDNVDGLDMKLPPSNFSLESIKALVGPKTLINVIDVATQQEVLPQWSLEQFVDYYNSNYRSKIYNVISLEVSKSKLAERVSPPATVRSIDWIDNVWPKDQTTNYPQVQLYCLMSVKGSFTDFHLDFGGTSVYYHILRGQKLFLFVPPTEENLKKFAEWTSTIEQHEVFFGDLVQDVYPVLVEQGQTLIVPTAWIHAVYTPQDSLVFGGNFLHSYNIKQQLAVYEVEESTKVPEKFRFPFYEQMMWYAAVKFLTQLKDVAANKRGPLSTLEHEGVIDLVATLDNWLKSNKKNESIPPTILNPRQLLSDLSDFLLKSPPEISPTSADPWLDVIQHNRQSGNIMTVSEIVDRIKNPSAYYDTTSVPDSNPGGLKITLQPQSSIPAHIAPPSADEVSLLASDDDFFGINPEKKVKTEANSNLFGNGTPQ